MANLIQIKRSLTTATAPSLANGELAFTANGDHLFIGSNGVSFTIAGKFNPGVLTANQALVANGTGYLDAVKADALTVRTLTANGVTTPGAGYLLSVDAGGNTYWLPQSSVSINTASQFSWTNTHSFAANVSFGGASTNTVIGSAGYVQSTNGVATTGPWNGGTVADGIMMDYVSGSGRIMVGTADSLNFFVGNTLAVAACTQTVSISSAGAINAASHTVGSTFVANTTKLTFTGANVDFATSTARFGNTTITGDLTVTGTVTTVDTTNLTVTDSLIRLAQGQAGSTTYTDAVDIGMYGVYGNTSVIKYSGLARDSATANWVLFKDQTGNPDNTAVDSTNAVATPIATLVTYLNSSGLVSNSTVVNITANASVSVALTANTLSLSTPLPATSGGLGFNTYTSGDIIVANTGNSLSKLSVSATAGAVLQSNGTAVVYATLDGGTF